MADKIKYKIGPTEQIGSIPGNTIIEVFLVQKGEKDDGLVYFPSKIEYSRKGHKTLDTGCESLGFAELGNNGIWKKSKLGYVNLPNENLFNKMVMKK